MRAASRSVFRGCPASLLGALLALAIIAADPACGQNSWDYSSVYSSNLRYYSQKQALKRKKGKRSLQRHPAAVRKATTRTIPAAARVLPYSQHTRFPPMGDEGRQKIYESALIPAFLAKSTSDRDLARRNLSALLGRDPEQVRLTAQSLAAH